MGLAHVAQPSYLALTNFGEVFTIAIIRCCVRTGILLGFPGSSFRHLSSARLLRGSGLCLGRSRGTRDSTLGFSPVAGALRLPLMSKIKSPYQGTGHGNEQRISRSIRSNSGKSFFTAPQTTASSTFIYSCMTKFRMSAASRHGTSGYFAFTSSETMLAASPTIVTYLSAAAF